MEFSTLQAQIRASRQVSKEFDGATFTIELPSDYAQRVTLEANRNDAGQMQFTQATRAVLLRAVVGWAGVTERHLLPEAPTESLPFSTAALAELIEERVDIADALMTEVGAKLAERRARREAARKN